MGLSLPLMQYLSDTDQQGNVVDDISGLTLEVVGIETIPGVGTSTTSPIVEATLSGFTLNIEPINDDDVGLAMITLRASDGIQESDTILTVSMFAGSNDLTVFNLRHRHRRKSLFCL